MNTYDSSNNPSLADALGAAVARRLSEGSENLPHSINERLKAARTRAVSQRKIANLQTASTVSPSGGAAVLHGGGGDGGWWNRIASLVPLVALVAGLACIAVLQEANRAHELAEVDAELLTDELPPAAFTDPGFAQFLRINQGH